MFIFRRRTKKMTIFEKIFAEHKDEIEEYIKGVIKSAVDDIKTEFAPGDHFSYKGVEFVVLDVNEERNELFAVTANIVRTMLFSEDNCNDWRKSDVRDWLNTEFLYQIGEEDLIEQVSDLVADNGDKAYGECKDYVSLLSCDQYRKYREFIPRYKEDWVWTLTPYSCDPSYANSVRVINPSGTLNTSNAYDTYGVVPACMYNLNNLKSRRQAHKV